MDRSGRGGSSGIAPVSIFAWLILVLPFVATVIKPRLTIRRLAHRPGRVPVKGASLVRLAAGDGS